MNKSNVLTNSVIFPKGEKMKIPCFTETAWLEQLVPKHSTFNCPIGNVSFEPGARTYWHKHPGGQLLLVTGGPTRVKTRGMQGAARYFDFLTRLE